MWFLALSLLIKLQQHASSACSLHSLLCRVKHQTCPWRSATPWYGLELYYPVTSGSTLIYHHALFSFNPAPRDLPSCNGQLQPCSRLTITALSFTFSRLIYLAFIIFFFFFLRKCQIVRFYREHFRFLPKEDIKNPFLGPCLTFKVLYVATK